MKLGPLELIEEIGRGGMAEVWRAEHASSAHAYAVKLVTSGTGGDRIRADAILREVRAVARLSHPNIVAIYEAAQVPPGVGLKPWSPYFVMEMARGGAIEVRPGGFTWPVARLVLESVLAGLAHAHAHGLLHRDVKPANVIVALPQDLRPGIKLTDFGLAHEIESTAELEGGAGTPQYMAPEQLRAESWLIGPWTDLYAVGCLAMAVTTGDPPFTGEMEEVVRAHLLEAPEPVPATRGLPPALGPWIARLLAKEPEDRYATAAEALRELVDMPGAPATLDALLHEMQGDVEPEKTMQMVVSLPPLDDTMSGEGPTEHESASLSRASSGWWRNEAHRRQPPGMGLGLARFREPVLRGREQAQSSLWSALSSMEQGGARVVIVDGPRGIGRSQLLRWFGARAEEAGVALALRLHRGDSAGGRVQEAIRTWLAVDGSHVSKRMVVERRVRATLSGKGELSALATQIYDFLNSESATQAARTTLQRLAEVASPLLCIVDDFGNEPSILNLVEETLRGSAPILWVLARRTGEGARTPSVDEHDRRVTSLLLEPLAVGVMRDVVAGVARLSPEAGAHLLQRGRGNPQLVLELLRAWTECGALVPGQHGFEVDPQLVDIGVPAEAWLGRAVIRALDGETALAEVAAVLGEEVSLTEWRAVSDALQLGPVDACISALAEVGLVVEETDRIRFVHPATHDFLAGQPGVSEWHAAAAKTLEARGAAPLRVAQHRAAAGQPEAAVAALLEGARGEIVANRPLSALLILDACEGHRAVMSSAQRTIVVALRARARVRAGGDLAVLLAELAPHQSEDSLAQADLEEARGHIQDEANRWDESVEMHERAAVLYVLAGRDDLALASTMNAADGVFYLGRRREAGRFYERALDMARASNDVAAQARLLWSVAYVDRAYDRLARARAHLLEGMALQGLAPTETIRLLSALGDVERSDGDSVAAERYARDALELCVRFGEPPMVHRHNLGATLMDQGRWAEAAQAFEPVTQAITRGETGHWVMVAVAGWVRCAAGTRDRAGVVTALAYFEQDDIPVRVDEEIVEQLDYARALIDDADLRRRIDLIIETQREGLAAADQS